MFDVKIKLPNIEPFDEFEALHSVLKHYYLGVSSNNEKDIAFINEIKTMLNISNSLTDRKSKPQMDKLKWIVESQDDHKCSRTFHSAVTDSDFFTYIFGGMGSETNNTDKQYHKKQNIILKLSDEVQNCGYIPERMSPISIFLPVSERIVIYGGRNSPKKPCDDMFIYNINSKSLEPIAIKNRNFQCTGIYRAAVCQVNDTIWSQYGGRTFNGEFINKLFLIRESFSILINLNLL